MLGSAKSKFSALPPSLEFYILYIKRSSVSVQHFYVQCISWLCAAVIVMEFYVRFGRSSIQKISRFRPALMFGHHRFDLSRLIKVKLSKKKNCGGS